MCFDLFPCLLTLVTSLLTTEQATDTNYMVLVKQAWNWLFLSPTLQAGSKLDCAHVRCSTLRCYLTASTWKRLTLHSCDKFLLSQRDTNALTRHRQWDQENASSLHNVSAPVRRCWRARQVGHEVSRGHRERGKLHLVTVRKHPQSRVSQLGEQFSVLHLTCIQLHIYIYIYSILVER